MSKLSLAAHIRSELPRIDAALDANVARMPIPTRAIALHILHAGGKRLRPLLTVLVARLLGYTHDDIYPLAATMEMMHAATLLHDDVIDNADYRRGKTAAHHLFGNIQAILGGDALLARASRVVASYNDLRLATCFSVALEETAFGQILELDRQSGRSQDLDTYFEVIRGKTAWMIRTACELGALQAGADEGTVSLAAEYGLQMGMAFQIVDDALDFAPSAQTGKPEGGDLREGKLTPPLHLYLAEQSEAERRDFLSRFAAEALTDDDITRLVRAVQQGGYAAAARAMADSYLDAARAALAAITPAPGGLREKELLESVIGYVRDRSL